MKKVFINSHPVAVVILVFSCVFCSFADVPFNGIIYDSNAKPMKGARIYTKSPRRYATSDKQGRFGLTDVQPDDTIHVKVNKRKIPYAIPVDGRKSMKIFLADEQNPKVNEDDELVSFGYGFVKKRESTGVSSGISGEDLVRTGQRDIVSALKGRVAGLDVSPSGEVTIRGVHSLTLSNEPLYIVDGVVVYDLRNINIHDVDYVEVLKDASIYGSRGANGAIIVYTKTGKSIQKK